jgi:hypothetical protein
MGYNKRRLQLSFIKMVVFKLNNSIKMKLLIFFLVIAILRISALNVEDCPLVELGKLKLHACKVNIYDNVYFHDITGENRITVFPNRYYNNHGAIVARCTSDTLYVGTEKYSNHEWIETFN